MLKYVIIPLWIINNIGDFMRLSEIGTENKPYIKIEKNNKKIKLTVTPKHVIFNDNENALEGYFYMGCDEIFIKHKGTPCKINWKSNKCAITLYCTNDSKAYKWDNISVVSLDNKSKKHECLLVTNQKYGYETERRKTTRYPAETEVMVQQGDIKISGITRDISLAGLGIIVPQVPNFKANKLLKITIGGTTIPAKLKRTVIETDGNILLGCFVSAKYKKHLAFMLKELGVLKINPITIKEIQTHQPYMDEGWKQKEIKRWH